MKPIFDPQRARRGLTLLTAGSFVLLAGCGGGGGGGGLASVSDPVGGDTGGGVGGAEGIGGTGLSTSGVITGTGSVFVNGVRFNVDNAEIFVNGQAASEADLALGMVVEVSGTREDDDNGVADRVAYDSLIEGVIESIERNADNSSARLRSLGQVILVERTSTVFEGASFDALTVGDRVEISGYRDEEGRIRATRLDGEDDVDDEVTVSGIIADLEGSRFFIGGQAIDASTANLDLEEGATLRDGLNVEVDGELEDGVLVATEVDERDDLRSRLDADDDASAEGAISSFVSARDFVVGGLPVDAGSAMINTGGLRLDDGLIVEVEGTWTGSVLLADRLTARRGRIELAAPLADIAGNTLSLQFGNETVSVTTDTRTLLDDDRDGIEYLRLSDLAIGDYVEVEATLDGSTLVATRVDRDDDDDEVEIQAPVDAFVEGSSITVLGLTFNVASAEFENAGDDDIPIADFFRNLRLGALVSITDEQPTDGFAEEVEFEFASSYDGDKEFLDDDEQRVDPTALPEAASAYLIANFPSADIAFIEVDDDEIEVYLADGTEVVFDLDGGFIESDFDDDDSDDDDDDDSDDDSDDNDSDDDSDGDDSDDDDSNGDDSDDDDSDDDSNGDDSNDDDSDDDSDGDDSDDDDSDDDSNGDDSDDDDSDDDSNGDDSNDDDSDDDSDGDDSDDDDSDDDSNGDDSDDDDSDDDDS